MFDLNALYSEDNIEVSIDWGGQVNFPNSVVEGSFLPQRLKFFFVDPGTKAKYSYVARVPKHATFLILHSSFKYFDKREYVHTAEKSVEVPKSKEEEKLTTN